MPRPEATLLDRLEGFLARHTSGDDLGLRLRGEQLAAGVRFVRLTREGTYDLVVANPPYQGTSKMADAKYVQKTYPLGRADLYTAFLLRGLELVREGSVSAMLTMRGWMFAVQYADLREHLLATHGLLALGDFDRGAFESVPDERVSVSVSVFVRAASTKEPKALCPTPREDTSRDAARTRRKRAATLCHEGCYTFDPAALKVVPERPLIYWWGSSELQRYRTYPLVSSAFKIFPGVVTGDNERFLRRWFEVSATPMAPVQQRHETATWPSYIKGAASNEWIEPVQHVIAWASTALELEVFRRILQPGNRSPPGSVAILPAGDRACYDWHYFLGASTPASRCL